MWRNAPNISYDDITGYEIRLVNSATNEEMTEYLDTSATFYSLDNFNEAYKHESTSVQVNSTTCTIIPKHKILLHIGSIAFK